MREHERIRSSIRGRLEIYQDINWENINQVWDGWSRLVMIPVSHTGGREFKSLLIHRHTKLTTNQVNSNIRIYTTKVIARNTFVTRKDFSKAFE